MRDPEIDGVRSGPSESSPKHGFGTDGSLVAGERVRASETYHAPRLRTPVHEHDVACVHFVLSGVYEESDRTGRHRLVAGEVLFKPPGIAHWNEFHEAGSVALRFEVDLESIPALERRLPRRPKSVRCPAIASIATRARDEIASGDDLAPVMVDGLALDLLTRIARADRPASRSDRRLARACASWLDANFTNPVALADAAAALGVERTTLARVFRRCTLHTVGDYLRHCRVMFAAEILRASPADRLADVAARAGFSDQSHLTRCFKKVIGETPARWRNRHAKR